MQSRHRLLGFFLLFGALAQTDNINIIHERTKHHPSHQRPNFYVGRWHVERCPKHFSNKRKRNIIRNKMAKQSRKINRRK